MEEDTERELKLLLQVQTVRRKYLHPLNLDNLIVTNNIFTVALLLQEYGIAYQAAKKSMDVYMSIYRYKHPMIAMKAYTIGSLLGQNIEEHESAKHYLGMAIDILTLTHGNDAQIVSEIKEYLESLLPVGERRVISGKLEFYEEVPQIVHPHHVKKINDEKPIFRFEPVYSLTSGVSQ